MHIPSTYLFPALLEPNGAKRVDIMNRKLLQYHLESTVKFSLNEINTLSVFFFSAVNLNLNPGIQVKLSYMYRVSLNVISLLK